MRKDEPLYLFFKGGSLPTTGLRVAMPKGVKPPAPKRGPARPGASSSAGPHGPAEREKDKENVA